ncbi:MAG: NPCBM/NEW2 domain-containing protein [Muribaculaceae bacterium]|nr:NPCBM/NEW2 domain-containing protein [Muribaculaceae bacterium]
MKIFLPVLCASLCTLPILTHATTQNDFKTWAPTPPMGWNSWDCYGPTVVESEVKANADYLAKKLKDYGWEYVVVDIRWYVENDKAGGYNQTNPIYDYDEWGRYIPAPNRFPSSVDGNGFKPLADYVHDLGLKFGIHIMRGIPKEAVQKKLPVKGTNGITADMIANNDSTCTWLRDNMKVDWRKPGAQEYYNSIFDMYAQWGVDFIKIDDLARPYHTAEVEMIRKAIDQCGRPIVLSISPGETPIEKVDHVKAHANMWRTVDDFWDNWSQLNYQFGICAKWAPYIEPGNWPDADMLPLGKISIRGERGAERYTNFTPDEQKTLMNLWTIFKSPLMFGGDLPQNDEATDALLTNRDVLYMHSHSVANRQVSDINKHITWSAIDPRSGEIFAALFNTGGNEYLATEDALWRSGTVSYLTTGHSVPVEVAIPAGSRQLFLAVTDGGDGYDSDHADWINPKVKLADGTEIDLTAQKILQKTAGWGEVHVNTNLEGGKLKVDGKEYDKGIATHANSILIFDLPENAVTFSALAGIDNTGSDQGSKSSVEFFVFNYDPTFRAEYTDQWTGGNVLVQVDPTKQVATSGFICREGNNPIVDIEAPIAGAEKLYLVVTNGGDNLSYDHADWVNPVLIKADGEEVSLTSIAWDANPINGWNDPKLNKNNDGNTLNLGGVDYESGFGVNAPSVLVFTLPSDHEFVTFKTRVGLDNDVASAPMGATVEFRVFTEDPTPNNDANVTLNLTALGLTADQKANIADMWTGESIGTFSNSEFAPFLREHGSGLYRISPLGRTDNASLQLNAEEKTETGEIVLTASLNGEQEENAYIQFECDGKILGSYKVENGGVTSLSIPAIEGTHTYKAYYSGNTEVANAESNEVKLESAGVKQTVLNTLSLPITPCKGGIEVGCCNAILSSAESYLDIYSPSGEMVKSVNLKSTPLFVSLQPGLYLIGNQKYLIE